MGDFVTVDQNEPSQQPLFARIVNIPLAMMATKDKESLNGLEQGKTMYDMGGFCSKRSFERLPGYIDLQVLSLDNCTTLLPKE